jgi:hypothetical protein
MGKDKEWMFDDLDPDFTIRATAIADNDTVRITSLTFEPRTTAAGDQPPNITGPVLRRISIGTIRRRIRRHLEGAEESSGPDPALGQLSLRSMRASTQAGRTAGRHRTDVEWAEIAQLYTSLCDSREPNITGRMAEALGESKDYASKLIYRATQHGMLEDRHPGLAGGRLTAKARGLLDEHPDSLGTPPIRVRRAGSENPTVRPGRKRG